MSRFAKYRADKSELFKPDEGESRIGRFVGDHEYDGGDKPVPVLDLEDADTGEK